MNLAQADVNGSIVAMQRKKWGEPDQVGKKTHRELRHRQMAEDLSWPELS